MGIIRQELRKINGLAYFAIISGRLDCELRAQAWRPGASDTDLTTSIIRNDGGGLVGHTVGCVW
jgi:hypothetical protein